MLAFGLWATLTESGRLLTGRWSFVEKAYVDRGTYFRLKVDLTYKGEPQHLDIVIGCNVANIDYKDGSSTREVGLVPTVYGRRMRDGKGLVVRAPDACHGETTSGGGVPANFMPVLVIYDDAATLGFGTAYMADEAYDSPRSPMQFVKATVEKATRAEFDDFRLHGALNLVTREQYHSAQPKDVLDKMGLTQVNPPFGRTCWAYSRSLIPQPLRRNLSKYWPAERPKFWSIPSYESLAALRDSLHGANLMRDDGEALRGVGPWIGPNWPGYGALHRKGSQPIGTSTSTLVATPSFYPFASDVSGASWPRDPAQWTSFVAAMPQVSGNIELAGAENRGTAYLVSRQQSRIPGVMDRRSMATRSSL